MSEKTLQMTMLLDFYGELLTEKQRSCFSMHYNDDYSLAEIAEELGISRQGARDLIVRAEATLTETEEKIGVIKRFNERKAVLASMTEKLSELERLTSGRAGELTKDLLKTIETLD